MSIEFALRDEIVNVFAMTHGHINSKMQYQFILCKKKPFSKDRMGPYLLDSKKSRNTFKLSSIGEEYLKSVKDKELKLNYIAYVEDQIEINLKDNINIIDKICEEGYFQVWNPEAPKRYFKGLDKGYIILFRVYEIDQEINQDLLKKGRSGRNFYYTLESKVDFKIKRPVLDDKEYFILKNNLINIIKNSDLYNEENNETYNEIHENEDSEYVDKFDEGKSKTVTIKTKERNREMIKKAKQLFKEKHSNQLFCEICGFDFKKVYGDIGEDFIECHHTIPVSTMNKDSITRIEDLVMVCSNCHSMIHRSKKLISVDELKRCIKE